MIFRDFSKLLLNGLGWYCRYVEMFLEHQGGVLSLRTYFSLIKESWRQGYFPPKQRHKAKFANKVAGFCNSIYAINKIISEDGLQKIGGYVVLDDKENINQQTVFDALNGVSEMHEKTSRFLMKTF